jgi:major type 1 subunit fimbrin (pilin)
MKKLLLSAVLVATLGAATVANAASTSTGTITVTGTVVASTCAVAVNGSQNPTVPLGNMIASMLPAGSAGGWQPVNMVISGCTAVTGYTNVIPYFSGTGVDTGNGYLKNTFGAGASNVEVALSTTQSLGGVLTLQNASGSQNAGTTPLTSQGSNTVTLSYYAGFMNSSGVAATAGGVNATVQYALNYQ